MNTKLIDIHNNWIGRFTFLYKDEIECMVCGATNHLERCHLIPRSLGGSDSVDNLVLLCHEHHRQAPNTCINKEIMLDWIENEAEKFSFTRGFGLSNELWNKMSDEGTRFLTNVSNKLDVELNQEVIEKIMGVLSDKVTIVSSHSAYNFKETIVNTMSFFNNNEEELDKFIGEHLKEVS